jgi:outer membrane protein TolC
VLSALQDAEDALTRYDAEQRRLTSLRESQAAANSSLHIAEEQYRAGVVTFINVLTASAALLTAQDQVAQSQQTLAQDLVSLYKALGGGWNAAAAENSVASE